MGYEYLIVLFAAALAGALGEDKKQSIETIFQSIIIQVIVFREEILPTSVLEPLDKLGIPPGKATYVCHLYDDEKGHLYQFSYRIAGNILGGEANSNEAGQCCHEPYPYGALGFREEWLAC